MIFQSEIIKISREKGLPKSTIDKDWVLGHFLAGIYSLPDLQDSLIFKGGTCLKKCWFKDYRFSEDLDFTSLSKDFVLTQEHIQQICQYVLDKSGIEMHPFSIRPLLHKNILVGYEAQILFWGADHRQNEVPPTKDRWHSKIKMEITLFEKMMFKPEIRPVYHTYSDQLQPEDLQIPCYSIEEVLAEKMRALIQRSYTAPRDYYDLWYLNQKFPNLDWLLITQAFHQKMLFKGFTFTGIDQLINPENEKALKGAWENSLSHQISRDELPSYEEINLSLKNLFQKLF